MKNSQTTQKPRTTEELLQEMETMSKGFGKSGEADHPRPMKEPGALKSLLGFFVKIVPDDDTSVTTVAHSASVPAGPPETGSVHSGMVGFAADESLPVFELREEATGDLSQKPFAEIYRDAGITESQLSVDELEKLLTNPTIAAQPMSVKLIAINLALSAKGVTIDVPIADAVRRDRVLESYQAMLLDRACEVERRNSEKIQQITAEIEAYLKRYQAEIDTLHLEITELNRQSKDFAFRREAEEQRLANLISPFLEGKPNPVLTHHQLETND